MKILIVEDDENSRVYLERALKSQNYTVESAANGVLALEKALLSPPDMIISDILMPEMDGFDLCRKVKANEKLQHIPFIFYTATFIDKNDEELAMSLGASRFIVKPFKMEELFKIITDVIEEHKEKKQPVPEKTLVEIEKIDEMYSGTIARKLDKKVAQLQKEIAEHKQTEETLRQSEERFSKAFQATPDAVEITRLSDERLIDVNEVFVRRFGYSRDDVVGHTTIEFNLWANQEDRKRYFTTMREQGNVREQESQFRMKSGEILDGLVSGETFSMGEEKYILTIIRDITKRKKAEDGLRESEARYRGLHESMADCFIQVAMSGEIVDVNRSYLEMLGYTAEEIKLRYKDITPAKWHEFEQKIVDTQIIARGYSDVYEKEYIRKDGTVFPVELRTYLLRNKEGKPFGMWTIIRDITERKRGEEALIESKEKYSNIIEFSNDMIWTADLSGRFTFCNKHTEEISGYQLEEWRNKDFSSLIMKEELPNLMKIFNTVLKGQPQQYDATVMKRDGTALILSINTAPLYSKGAMIGTVSFGRDITQHKREEEERIQSLAREHAALAEAQAARKLDQLKSIFIASTSHELRTPLNAIIGFSSMLLDGFSGELNPEQKKQLDIVHSAGKHLLLLISDVIDVSKIEAGKIDLKVSGVELRAVVDEAVSTLGASIKEKGLELNVEVEDITIKTDKRRLLQCIFNLIGNAVKYSEKGSIRITAKTTGNRVDISVIDTGIGIKKEDIPKLFAPFIRLQTPLTEKTQGTRLGLYLVKKLAKDYLGGDVEVESEYGKGSKFTLKMPIELEEKGMNLF